MTRACLSFKDLSWWNMNRPLVTSIEFRTRFLHRFVLNTIDSLFYHAQKAIEVHHKRDEKRNSKGRYELIIITQLVTGIKIFVGPKRMLLLQTTKTKRSDVRAENKKLIDLTHDTTNQSYRPPRAMRTDGKIETEHSQWRIRDIDEIYR